MLFEASPLINSRTCDRKQRVLFLLVFREDAPLDHAIREGRDKAATCEPGDLPSTSFVRPVRKSGKAGGFLRCSDQHGIGRIVRPCFCA